MRLIDADALRQVLEVFTEKDTLGHTPLQLCDAMTAASPWHRVEDGLPKEEKRYFVWEADGYAFCDTWKEGKWKIGSGVPGTHITHWMPLPEPPKEVKNE